MSEALREFERAQLADPTPENLARLQDERVRRGLGWHGETLPSNDCVRLVPLAGERGVYVLKRHDSYFDPNQLQFVFVPGGEFECDRCHNGTYPITTALYVNGDPKTCAACDSTGKKKLAPFYIGRFPIMLREWMWNVVGVRDYGLNQHRLAHLGKVAEDKEACHPVTRVSLINAIDFCDQLGLRLPSESEWKWAALGEGPVTFLEPRHVAGANYWLAGACWARDGMIARLDRAGLTKAAAEKDLRDALQVFRRSYPWGNEPPSPERCVWSEHPIFGTPFMREIAPAPGMIFRMRPLSPLPVLVQKIDRSVEGMRLHFTGSIYTKETPEPVMVPARPDGASWCGALEMAGNVWEWVLNGPKHARRRSGRGRDDAFFTFTALGGSYLDRLHALWPYGPDHRGREFVRDSGEDDVGFRVALSAVTA